MSTTDAPEVNGMTNKNSYCMDYICDNCNGVVTIRIPKGVPCQARLVDVVCDNCGCYGLELDQ